MAKITWKPGTMEYPLPPVMISCGTMDKPNIMTAAWTGIISSEPAMTYVSIRPSRYSHQLIKENGEFVINLTTLPLVTAADYCGVKSGKDVDKFKEMNLTAAKCSQVSCPQIEESPVSIECKVVSVTNYGSHDMFLAEIVAVNVDDKYIDEKGKLWLEKAGLIAYSHSYYYTLGRNVGFFGFSVCRSALKAKEKMKNVVVEVKEPKIIQPQEEKREHKFENKRHEWKQDRPRRKFEDKSRFSRGKESAKFEDSEKREFNGERKFKNSDRKDFRGEKKFGDFKKKGFSSERREFDGERKRDFGGERKFNGERKFKNSDRKDFRGDRKPSFNRDRKFSNRKSFEK